MIEVKTTKDLKDAEGKPVVDEAGKVKKREFITTFDFGKDLADATAKFTDAVVFSKYVKAAKIELQAVVRRFIDAGLSDEDIEARIAPWKPGVSVEKVSDPKGAAIRAFLKMDDKEQADFLAGLRDAKNSVKK